MTDDNAPWTVSEVLCMSVGYAYLPALGWALLTPEYDTRPLCVALAYGLLVALYVRYEIRVNRWRRRISNRLLALSVAVCTASAGPSRLRKTKARVWVSVALILASFTALAVAL